MDLETLRDYCLRKKGTDEAFPFGESVMVLRVAGKMFALIGIENVPLTINLKCEPELAVELRDRYDAVRPGYHMNKKLWNTVVIDGSIREREILEMIDHSYDEVVKTLKKKEREALAG
jgi:predicted DNA-binding protein (MmcQ/YjbR family)